jgi:HSP20 family molecular chaperone IbpA
MDYPQLGAQRYVIDKSDDTKYLLQFVLPGIDKENLKIEIKNWTLHFSIIEQKEKKFSIPYPTTFTWDIPEDGDIDKSNAELRNGILTIEFPKKQHEVKILQIN